MIPERAETDKDLRFMPVFCTAGIPSEVINDFLQAATDGRGEADSYVPALITTSDIGSIVRPSRAAPTSGFTSPFLDQSPDDIYAFFKSHIRPLTREITGPWTHHTFAILDARTATDRRTAFLCSDVPDFLERERVVLKRVRTEFAFALLEGMCYETYVRCPSETGRGALGAGDVLTAENLGSYLGTSIQPPPMTAKDKRDTISYGYVNEHIPEGRRWWDRYRDEGPQ